MTYNFDRKNVLSKVMYRYKPFTYICKEPHRASPETDCATPDLSGTVCPAFLFATISCNEAEAAVRRKRSRGSRERESVHAQCEPEETMSWRISSSAASEQFAISFEARLA